MTSETTHEPTELPLWPPQAGLPADAVQELAWDMFADLDRDNPTADQNHAARLAALNGYSPENPDNTALLQFKLAKLALLPRPVRDATGAIVAYEEVAGVSPEDRMFARMFGAEVVTQTYAQAIDEYIGVERGVDGLTKLDRWETFSRKLRRTYEHEPRAGEIVRQSDGSTGRPLLVLFVDGNQFGEINKQYTHIVGDQAIVGISQPFRDLRQQDLKSRRGGDEFVAAIMGMDYESAGDLCARFSAELAEGMQVPLAGGGFIRFTASTIAAYNPNVENYDQANALLIFADQLLGKVKALAKERRLAAAELTAVVVETAQHDS